VALSEAAHTGAGDGGCSRAASVTIGVLLLYPSFVVLILCLLIFSTRLVHVSLVLPLLFRVAGAGGGSGLPALPHHSAHHSALISARFLQHTQQQWEILPADYLLGILDLPDEVMRFVTSNYSTSPTVLYSSRAFLVSLELLCLSLPLRPFGVYSGRLGVLRDCVEKVEKLGYRVEMRESMDEQLVARFSAQWGDLAVVGTDKRDTAGINEGRGDAENGSDAAKAGNKRMRLNDDET
jgi:hypothetical protein